MAGRPTTVRHPLPGDPPHRLLVRRNDGRRVQRGLPARAPDPVAAGAVVDADHDAAASTSTTSGRTCSATGWCSSVSTSRTTTSRSRRCPRSSCTRRSDRGRTSRGSGSRPRSPRMRGPLVLETSAFTAPSRYVTVAEHRAALLRLATTGVHARATDPRRCRRPVHADLRDVRVRPDVHRRQHAARRRPRRAPRCVSGLRPPRRRLSAGARPRGADT